MYHKGYDIREPIEVRVLPDKIEILSHPGADRSISLEGLKNYRVSSRRYRNRRIGEFLKELHLTEGRNTGFQKIVKAMNVNGSPVPIFETDADRTYFLTSLPIHPGFISSDEARNEARNDTASTELIVNERLVMNAIAQNPFVTTAQMMAMSGLSKASIQRAIKSLKEKNRIAREGSAKAGKWIILK